MHQQYIFSLLFIVTYTFLSSHLTIIRVLGNKDYNRVQHIASAHNVVFNKCYAVYKIIMFCVKTIKSCVKISCIGKFTLWRPCREHPDDGRERRPKHVGANK